MNTPANNASWHALNIDAEPLAREAVEYALMEAGALGTVTDDVNDRQMRVVGYFENIPNREKVRNELSEALRIYSLPSSSVREMTMAVIDNRDWLEEWKKSWQPVVTGRFIIAPPWSDVKPNSEQLVIRIEPGMAFGTGTHETTRLCLSAIEKHYKGGSFLDVGTGTGILAIAAAKLFAAANIEACDVDADAVAIAQANATDNEVGNQIKFRVGSIDDASPSADLVCANLTADVILPMTATLINLTCGKLILSGILDTQVDEVIDAVHRAGVANVQVTQDGEWVCCVV